MFCVSHFAYAGGNPTSQASKTPSLLHQLLQSNHIEQNDTLQVTTKKAPQRIIIRQSPQKFSVNQAPQKLIRGNTVQPVSIDNAPRRVIVHRPTHNPYRTSEQQTTPIKRTNPYLFDESQPSRPIRLPRIHQKKANLYRAHLDTSPLHDQPSMISRGRLSNTSNERSLIIDENKINSENPAEKLLNDKTFNDRLRAIKQPSIVSSGRLSNASSEQSFSIDETKINSENQAEKIFNDRSRAIKQPSIVSSGRLSNASSEQPLRIDETKIGSINQTSKISSNGLQTEKYPYSNISSVEGQPHNIADYITPRIKNDIDLRSLNVKLYNWETKHYKQLQPQEQDYLKGSIEQYELKSSASLKQNTQLYFEQETDTQALNHILQKMPSYEADLYYPVVMPQYQIESIHQRLFKFDPYMIAPAHPIKTDLKYAALQNNTRFDESVVLLQIKPQQGSTHPITSLQDEPDSLNFITSTENTYFRVSEEWQLTKGFYRKKFILIPAQKPNAKQLSETLKISHHRLQHCSS